MKKELSDADLMERGFQRKRLVYALIIAGVALIPVLMAGACIQRLFFPRIFDETYDLTAEQRATVEAALNAGTKRAAELDAQFARGTAKLTELVPRPDLGGCPVTLPSRSMYQSNDFFIPPYRLRSVTPSDLPNLESGLSQSALTEAESIRSRLENVWYNPRGPSDLLEDAENFGRSPGPDFEVIMVVSGRTQPVPGTAETGFIPGFIIGRAYLYHSAMGRIICAADVSATNSEAIDYEYQSLSGLTDHGSNHAAQLRALNVDLERQLSVAIARSMTSAAGPPLPPPPPPEQLPEPAAEEE